MSDEFKKRMDHKCGPGGTKCFCCNSWDKGDKPVLRRMVRRAMKQLFKKTVKQELNS